MATAGDQQQATEEVVSVEMPAPEGWAKKVGRWVGGEFSRSHRSNLCLALLFAAPFRTDLAGFELRLRGIRGCGSGIRAGEGVQAA
jgi:hypothetical protein